MDQSETARKGKEESEVTATLAVATFSDLIDRAANQPERFVITTHGKPKAAVVGIDDLERLRALDAA